MSRSDLSFALAAGIAVMAGACDDAETEALLSGPQGGRGGSSTYTQLITGDWELEPFSENTSDKHTLTLDRDVYVGAIRPIAPAGTHHTTLTTTYLGAKETVYGSGLGSNALEFPPGVGLKLEAGTTLVLELHLLNSSGTTLRGTSGIEIVEVDAADVEHEADVYAPGPLELTLPPNQQTIEAASCTAQSSFTVFAMFPHMHQLGRHMRTAVEVDGVETVIHDDDFSFDSQVIHPVGPIDVRAGDKITTACTFVNDTSDVVNWGTSSNAEMCLSILYRYPAHRDSGFCSQ
jgi:hypothetical protein